jgi:hypothetical protein
VRAAAPGSQDCFYQLRDGQWLRSVKELRQRLEASSTQQQQQQQRATAGRQGTARLHSSNSNLQRAPTGQAAAAATLQRNNSGSSGRQLPASNTQGIAAAADSASTGKPRPASSQQIAAGAVGREDGATWAAAVGRVRRTWPGFEQQLEAQLAQVRVSTRPNGERHDTSGCVWSYLAHYRCDAAWTFGWGHLWEVKVAKLPHGSIWCHQSSRLHAPHFKVLYNTVLYTISRMHYPAREATRKDAHVVQLATSCIGVFLLL